MAIEVSDDMIKMLKKYGDLLKDNQLSEFYKKLQDENKELVVAGSFTHLLLDSGMSVYDIFNHLDDEIPTGCFANCTLPDILTVPKKIITMCDSAFEECYGLRELSFNATEIHLDGFFIFAHCNTLEKIILPELAFNVVPSNCFSFCPSLKEVIFTAHVSNLHIGSNAFGYNIPKDCKIYIPDSVRDSINGAGATRKFFEHVIWT